jgi:hypothetical protein
MRDPRFSLEELEFLSGRNIPEPRLAFPATSKRRAAIGRIRAGNHLA